MAIWKSKYTFRMIGNTSRMIITAVGIKTPLGDCGLPRRTEAFKPVLKMVVHFFSVGLYERALTFRVVTSRWPIGAIHHLHQGDVNGSPTLIQKRVGRTLGTTRDIKEVKKLSKSHQEGCSSCLEIRSRWGTMVGGEIFIYILFLRPT